MNRQTILAPIRALICSTALLLSGCMPVTQTVPTDVAAQSATSPKIARQAAESTTFSDLDPASACVTQAWVLGNVYETLTRYNLPGNEPFVIPGLAKKWSVSADGMTWTFHLQEGVKFHDGSDFTAEAVKFTVERNQQLNQCSAYIYEPVQSIETPDLYTVVFHLSQPAAMDAILASGFNAWIMSPFSVKDKDTTWFATGNEAGTGPYRIAKYSPGQSMLLERFNDYWRGWEPNQFDNIEFVLVEDMTTAEQMLRAGQLDFATNRALTQEQMLSLDAEEHLTLLATRGNTPWYIFLNQNSAPTDNLLVRQALAYSFPYNDVIANTNLGKGTRAHSVVPQVIWGHDPEPSPYTFDLKKAKALLVEAGYSDGFALTISFDPPEQVMAELWQAELAKIKIVLTLAPSDFTTRWEVAKSDSPTAPQANTIFWGPDVIGPYTYLAPFDMTILADWNLSRYNNPAYNALINEGKLLAVTDQNAASEIFIAAQRMLNADVAAIFIEDLPILEMMASDLTGHVTNPAYNFVTWYDVRR